MASKQNISVGIDLEDISRFSKLYAQRKRQASKNFLAKVYTEKELDYCFSRPKPAQHLAARFCAKEAVIKAFLSKGKKIAHSEIEVLNNKDGAPKAKLIAKGCVRARILLSLSHTPSSAAACAICIFQ